MRKKFVVPICWLFLLVVTKAQGQTIALNYSQQPLNEILLDLNDRYKVQVSINSQLSANCIISIKQSFPTMESALRQLAKKCRLTLIKISDVYTFRKDKTEVKPSPEKKHIAKKKLSPKKYTYQGQVVEQTSLEPLPFSVIQLNKGYVVADQNGRFSFKTLRQTQVVKCQHLGYKVIDTLLLPGGRLRVVLKPQIDLLQEVTIRSTSETCVARLGKNAGRIKFNDLSNSLVPGASNDLIFNNLRLYPGIMASGESTSDFIIWGAYPGQNHVLYDGITMFNSWGVNDDIGRVNPFMIKNMEVYKGGYNVPYGDRVGGVVLINTKAGNRDKATADISLNNRLANLYLSVPLFNHSASLQIAGRKSYYQLLDLSVSPVEDKEVIIPNYDYSDLHLKFSSSFANQDQLEISFIASRDNYEGVFRSNLAARKDLVEDVNVQSEQIGSSLKYIKNWGKAGGVSTLVLAQSNYSPELTSNHSLQTNLSTEPKVVKSFTWGNQVAEYSGKLTHQWALGHTHQLELNAGVVANETVLKSQNQDKVLQDTSTLQTRLTFYAHDQLRLSTRLHLQLGMKADVPLTGNQVYVQPRINARYDLGAHYNIHFGWGKYYQFVAKNTIIDAFGNQTDIWQVSDGVNAPVTEAVHHVLGGAYLTKGFEASMEGYYKTSSGFRRFVIRRNTLPTQLNLEARSLGLDVYIKKRFRRHELWFAYSWARVEERLNTGRQTADYRLAPQSQQHELKAALVLNFSPFHLSLTNVNGSGFSNSPLERANSVFQPYHRTDIALQYRFQWQHTYFEAGCSILNFFNQVNVRLNQSVNVPNDNSIVNTVGIPFTPTVYLNAKF
ncbi:TonB-dependent receptor [Microscilla marina]|uniref:TonB-dependent receptor n=1 Tax=Microscilla marina TaxID=1027 RepID=UPI0009E45CC2|nr:TonB-dependent receptor plug domain-containing protein [Microscilla marina]